MTRASASARALGRDFRVTSDDGIEHVATGIVLRVIPAGRLRMGFSDAEVAEVIGLFAGRDADVRAIVERSIPQHDVDLPEFLCAEAHVPFAVAKQFVDAEMMDSDRALVSPSAARELAAALRMRLLSEAEWEWVAREGGRRSWLIDRPAAITFDLDPSEDTCAASNAFGIRHLVSELGELVADGWNPTYAAAQPTPAPRDPDRGPGVLRGAHCSWQDAIEAMSLHVATRQPVGEDGYGVRLALDIPSAARDV